MPFIIDKHYIRQDSSVGTSGQVYSVDTISKIFNGAIMARLRVMPAIPDKFFGFKKSSATPEGQSLIDQYCGINSFLRSKMGGTTSQFVVSRNLEFAVKEITKQQQTLLRKTAAKQFFSFVNKPRTHPNPHSSGLLFKSVKLTSVVKWDKPTQRARTLDEHLNITFNVSIDPPLPYARIHEFGYKGPIYVRAHTRSRRNTFHKLTAEGPPSNRRFDWDFSSRLKSRKDYLQELRLRRKRITGRHASTATWWKNDNNKIVTDNAHMNTKVVHRGLSEKNPLYERLAIMEKGYKPKKPKGMRVKLFESMLHSSRPVLVKKTTPIRTPHLYVADKRIAGMDIRVSAYVRTVNYRDRQYLAHGISTILDPFYKSFLEHIQISITDTAKILAEMPKEVVIDAEHVIAQASTGFATGTQMGPEDVYMGEVAAKLIDSPTYDKNAWLDKKIKSNIGLSEGKKVYNQHQLTNIDSKWEQLPKEFKVVYTRQEDPTPVSSSTTSTLRPEDDDMEYATPVKRQRKTPNEYADVKDPYTISDNLFNKEIENFIKTSAIRAYRTGGLSAIEDFHRENTTSESVALNRNISNTIFSILSSKEKKELTESLKYVRNVVIHDMGLEYKE